MVVKEIDAESNRVANSILILGGSVLILAIILKLITNDNFLSSMLAIILGFVFSIFYYIKSIFYNKSQKKDSPKIEVNGS